MHDFSSNTIFFLIWKCLQALHLSLPPLKRKRPRTALMSCPAFLMYCWENCECTNPFQEGKNSLEVETHPPGEGTPMVSSLLPLWTSIHWERNCCFLKCATEIFWDILGNAPASSNWLTFRISLWVLHKDLNLNCMLQVDFYTDFGTPGFLDCCCRDELILEILVLLTLMKIIRPDDAFQW